MSSDSLLSIDTQELYDAVAFLEQNVTQEDVLSAFTVFADSSPGVDWMGTCNILHEEKVRKIQRSFRAFVLRKMWRNFVFNMKFGRVVNSPRSEKKASEDVPNESTPGHVGKADGSPPRKKMRKGYTCRTCGQTGHNSAKCPNKENQSQQRQVFTSAAVIDHNHIVIERNEWDVMCTNYKSLQQRVIELENVLQCIPVE